MKPLASRLLASLLSIMTGILHAEVNSSAWTKSIGIQYATPESNAPSIVIEYPMDEQRVADSVIQARIEATDETRVESFRFSLNGTQGDWSWAPAMEYPWGASLLLSPGLNTFEVECADYWGNIGSASVTFEYVPGSGLTLEIGNGGKVKPNYQGAALDLGRTYSMTARPAKGFRFDGWSGSLSSTRAKLKFIMQPNLSLTARFRDVKRPVNMIVFRRTKANAAGTVPFAAGKASDNSAVINVYYQLNGGGWETASTTNGWRNWETAALSPLAGRNMLESYAIDDSGLHSRTNRLKFRY